MLKKLIVVASLFFIASPAYAEDYDLSADILRITKSSTVITIDDVSTCFETRKKLTDSLSGINKKYKTYYPHLTIPNVDTTFNMESQDISTLDYTLGQILFNPANSKYYYFQCIPVFNTGKELGSKQMFAEVLTVEQVQAEIDRHYAAYLAKENKKSDIVSNILGFK